jgi:hypothetical protein
MKKPVLLHLDAFGAGLIEPAPDGLLAPVFGHLRARVEPAHRCSTGRLSGCRGGCGVTAP